MAVISSYFHKNTGKLHIYISNCAAPILLKYGSGHETVAVLLPGFAINWKQNQVTRQPQFRDLTHMTIIWLVHIFTQYKVWLEIDIHNVN